MERQKREKRERTGEGERKERRGEGEKGKRREQTSIST
jgi:hypothetical protein